MSESLSPGAAGILPTRLAAKSQDPAVKTFLDAIFDVSPEFRRDVLERHLRFASSDEPANLAQDVIQNDCSRVTFKNGTDESHLIIVRSTPDSLTVVDDMNGPNYSDWLDFMKQSTDSNYPGGWAQYEKDHYEAKGNHEVIQVSGNGKDVVVTFKLHMEETTEHPCLNLNRQHRQFESHPIIITSASVALDRKELLETISTGNLGVAALDAMQGTVNHGTSGDSVCSKLGYQTYTANDKFDSWGRRLEAQDAAERVQSGFTAAN